MASPGQVFKFKVDIEKTAEAVEEVEYEKNVGLTRTLISAMAGDNFYKVFAWVGGKEYTPIMNCMIKNEPKKFRKLVNADMVTFTKQSFVYHWIMASMEPDVKKKFYYYLDTKERLEKMERISRMCKNEKWACPLDLRDFHVQFGTVQHQRFIDCLARRSKSIQDRKIRREIEHLLAELRSELTYGTAEFTCILPGKENDFRSVVSKDRISKLIKLNKISYKDQYIEETQQTKSKFEFKISNGILSGWKLTSLMGSTYNLTLTTFLSSMGFRVFGLYPSDTIVQGDDTHFKTRYLCHALYHFAGMNSIGKDAHPKKQFISSRYTEFLKTVYDMRHNTNNYSPGRMISSLCYEKSNRPVKTERVGWFKDLVDCWNLFLIRIPDVGRQNFIINKGYPLMSIRTRFKLQGLPQDDLRQLMCNPPRLGKYLLGPITPHFKMVQADGMFRKDRPWMRATVAQFEAVYKMRKVDDEKWRGVQTMTEGILA